MTCTPCFKPTLDVTNTRLSAPLPPVNATLFNVYLCLKYLVQWVEHFSFWRKSLAGYGGIAERGGSSRVIAECSWVQSLPKLFSHLFPVISRGMFMISSNLCRFAWAFVLAKCFCFPEVDLYRNSCKSPHAVFVLAGDFSNLTFAKLCSRQQYFYVLKLFHLYSSSKES